MAVDCVWNIIYLSIIERRELDRSFKTDYIWNWYMNQIELLKTKHVYTNARYVIYMLTKLITTTRD